MVGRESEAESNKTKLEAGFTSAIKHLIQTAIVQQIESTVGTIQFTDEDIKREQSKSVIVNTLKKKWSYRG
ncbi:hypothetical protein GN958_ATG07670 [Phytophthora infestans]|uniref:Uncharacterized protein n=1 Tax=Phytophthora infestans TaxID=4787 RepID=A0A8S9UR13_PHYIN|nr:hypothetical protein GN958_ATG07670 [Phytophthora infestans]